MNWYLVQTKSNNEKVALYNLQKQGYLAWCPEYKKEIRHARKIKIVKRPLFPGYILVKLSPIKPKWYSINSTIGVSKLVIFGGEPAILKNNLFNILKNFCDEKNLVKFKNDDFEEGDKVQITKGPFMGWNGNLIRIDAKSRVIILLNALGTSIRSSVEKKDIIPI
jgi:transcriptional antiterminator RfaH